MWKVNKCAKFLFVPILLMFMGYFLYGIIFPISIKPEAIWFEYQKDSVNQKMIFNYTIENKSITPLNYTFKVYLKDDRYSKRIIYEDDFRGYNNICYFGSSITGFIDTLHIDTNGLTENEIEELKESIGIQIEYDNMPFYNRTLDFTGKEYGYIDRTE